MNITDLDIRVENAGEIISMGGPWIGDLFVSGKFVSKDCLFDNYVLKEDGRLLFFIKYHLINRYWYFSINFLDIDTFIQYEFDEEFTMAYLGRFIGENQLEVYRAFHDKFSSHRFVFDLDEETFRQVI